MTTQRVTVVDLVVTGIETQWIFQTKNYLTIVHEFQRSTRSDALKTTERFKWKDGKTISYRLTMDDPKIFTKPWSKEFQIIAKPEWDQVGLFEYVCEENNRCPGGKCASK
jgi:hypothetical protein